MIELLSAVSALSRELVYIMHEYPELTERLTSHQIKIRQTLANMVGNDELAQKRYESNNS